MEEKQPPKGGPDQERYHCLFVQHYRRIYGIVYHILRRREAAEDITQEAFVKAFQKMHQLKDPDKFGAWLAAIASNLARNYWHREKKVFLAAEVAPSPGSDRDNPERAVLRNLEADRVREALQGLPPEQYQVVVLQYYYDLKIKEIARLLRIRVGTVKSRLFRARRRLSEGLAEQKPGLGSLHYEEGKPKNEPKF